MPLRKEPFNNDNFEERRRSKVNIIIFKVTIIPIDRDTHTKNISGQGDQTRTGALARSDCSRK